MTNKRKTIPSYIQRGILGLIILLISISVARLLVSIHQQQERIEILEEEVSQLLSDTSRLQIQNIPGKYYNNNYSGYRHRKYDNPSYTQRFTRQEKVVVRQDTIHQRSVTTLTSMPLAEKSANVAPKRKFTEVHQFDLNTIDSATLIRIPGIADRTASIILKYRQKYGGFYDPWQLQDFLTWDAAQAYIEEWCSNWFTADAARILPIYVNKATVSELQRHPYITHEQAIELIRYRSRHKKITTATELQQLPSFSAEQIQRLLPYLSFE